MASLRFGFFDNFMISVTELRIGVAFAEDNQIFQVVAYEHTKMGRGTANVKVKIKNLRTGAVLEKTYTSGAKVQEIELERKPVQFLYKDEKNAYFMDTATFEEYRALLNVTANEVKYLNEGANAHLLLFGHEALLLEIPLKMEFKILAADPGIRGNSATNIYKDAVLENGLKVRVPLFIKEGEKVRIDTRTGEYVERVS